MTGIAIVCLGTLSLAPVADKPAGRLELESGELKAGLVAEYRSVADPKATLTRVEPKPAFALGASSPHPRIQPGPFAVVWTGVLSIRDPGPITISAIVGGELTMTVDGTTLLDGRGTTETSRLAAKEAFNREPGEYRVTIRFRSLVDVPARLQLWWEGPSFVREVIPAWRFGHIDAELAPAARQEELAERGRTTIGRFGCARCHSGAFPAITAPPPGPTLADVGRRVSRGWLMNWLADPSKVRPDANMPALFTADRAGFVERWIVADQLAGHDEKRSAEPARGDHRAGKIAFLSLGCAACHFAPDVDRAEQSVLNRTSLITLGDRYSEADLATFLGNPHGRYPDGRMPRVPVPPDQARHIAAFLLLWSKPSEIAPPEPPTAKEIDTAVRRLSANDRRAAADLLLRDKGCQSCHPGLGDNKPRDLPIKNATQGCLGDTSGPRFAFGPENRKAIQAYLAVANRETHPSPFFARQERLVRAGCMQCHQRDSDRPPPIEEAGSKLGGAFLQEVPYMRIPRLTNPHQKLTRGYLATTVREGNPNLRWSRYSYRMPAFGAQADELVQALAEGDGELVSDADPPPAAVADPTLGTLHGSRLTGFQGYACVSCHVWNGRQLASADPIATGPDLLRTAGRLRRDWFDRFMENPLRYYPGTPMPSVFPHGKPATLASVLEGDAAKQKDALWAYFAMGKDAPSPKPPPPVPIDAPKSGDAAIVAQIPIRLADGKVIESLCVLSADHELLVYDLATASPQSLLFGGQILRNVQGRVRQFLAVGTVSDLSASPPLRLVRDKPEEPSERTLLSYVALADGVRVHWKVGFPSGSVVFEDTLRFLSKDKRRCLIHELHFAEIPDGAKVELRGRVPPEAEDVIIMTSRNSKATREGRVHTLTLTPDGGKAEASFTIFLPAPRTPAKWDLASIGPTDVAEGSLTRPGYKAIAYPRPKTISGEDRVMPGAVAVRPSDGQVFVASMKTGELLALHDPDGGGKSARFERYGNGLYQDALSMLAEDDGLYVLHRRNLTRIVESQGQPTEFVRVAALPHGVADTYDMAYGLARDKAGRFVHSYAPYADQKLPGAGGALRLTPGKPPEEIAFGMRNPLGWCAGPDGEIFFTDNQGDWVATNKLCHIVEGRYYGWPNRMQKQHISKPAGKTTVWVPYGWARSINGVAYDNTGGKFGPFAGQFFMAELMFGGAIIRANVEKVNGVYQGACFPFWGKGLLGPVCLAFDSKGPLYVGGITEPGWMAQPDRGALFRIDYTGQVPFEMQSIHVRPRGFRIVFTDPVDKAAAGEPTSYRLEHYRYEYTGAYGSPELDRTAVKIEGAEVSADGRSVELTVASLVPDRVYLLTAGGVRSAKGEGLVHKTGAYTLNEIPGK